MSQLFEVHPQNPQPRLLRQAAQILQGKVPRGAVNAQHWTRQPAG